MVDTISLSDIDGQNKITYYGLLKHSNKTHTSIAAYMCNILQVTKPDDKGLKQKLYL